MPPKTAKFQPGEKILCFHGPLLYEAKCVTHEIIDKQLKYLVHYNGWNKNWDEWIPENRALKLNDANIQRQKELEAEHAQISHKVKKSKSGKKSDALTKSSQKAPTSPAPQQEKQKTKADDSKPPSRAGTPLREPPAKKRKTKIDPTVEPEDVFNSSTQIQIKIPDDLKTWLVDDWDQITRQNKIVQLPSKNTIAEILASYIKYRTLKDKSVSKDTCQEITEGITDYFNILLGKQLLYKFERPQYSEILQKHGDKPMSEIYGPMHLLRLFVRLGSYLAYSSLDEKAVTVVINHLHDFLKYMQRNSTTLFSLNDYVTASPEYHRKAL